VDEVWVITTHEGWGEAADVMGVYATPEAARAALEAAPNMKVTEEHGGQRGVPVDEDLYPHTWARIEKHQVKR
jgi:hypothetical protein